MREEFGVLIVEGLSQGHGDDVAGHGLVPGGEIEHRFGDAAVVRGVVVEAELVPDPEPDEEGDGHAGGEAGDIDKAIAFILDQVAPGEEEIVLEHVSGYTKIMPFV
jgi:hypothetical protein